MDESPQGLVPKRVCALWSTTHDNEHPFCDNELFQPLPSVWFVIFSFLLAVLLSRVSKYYAR